MRMLCFLPGNLLQEEELFILQSAKTRRTQSIWGCRAGHGSHAPVFRTCSSALLDIIAAKPPTSSQRAVNKQHFCSALNGHDRIGWRSPTDPRNLLQLSVRQNKATPENLSPGRCFSPLLFKARSRWEACFSFRVRTNDPEGSLWRGGICYLRVHNQVFHLLQGPGKSVPAWTKRCDFQGTVLESSRHTTDTFQLPEEDIASAATGKKTLQTHSLLVLPGSWYTDSFWIFCTSAHYYFITVSSTKLCVILKKSLSSLGSRHL